jgi:hypothetical protein
MQPSVAEYSTTLVVRSRLRLAQMTSAVLLATWRFVYVFFSNGTPFDAPNRSETCHTV